jgi:Tfp pilus assembly PilM family ATPase
MQRLVAIEWDSNELRVALAHQKGKSAVVDEAFGIPFNEKGAPVTAAEIGSLLGKELQQRGIPKGDALIAVGRSNLELRFLTTPPAPPEELPDLVRFQAMRQFTTLGDDWPLDFSPLGNTADGSTNVLATTISPEIVTQIRAVCTAAGLTPSHLVLRPFAAASLLRKSHQDDRCRMSVELLGEDADLAVSIGPDVVYPRTVRLPSNEAPPEVRNRALIGEIKRTIVAAQNQLGGRRVEQLIIFGDARKQTELQTAWKNDLQIDLKVLDPFTLVELSESLQRTPTSTPGAFAPLLGLLTDEAAGRSHTIDFLHPRKRPAPVNHNRTYAVVGGALAAAVLLLIMMGWWHVRSLDAEILEQATVLAKTKEQANKGKAAIKKAMELDKFTAADVNWLEELDRLSQKFPPAEEARADDLVATAKQNTGGGSLLVQGLAANTNTINTMEAALRDKDRTIIGSGTKEDPKAKGLTWRYREEIVVHGPGGAPGGTRTVKPASTLGKPAAKGGAK